MGKGSMYYVDKYRENEVRSELRLKMRNLNVSLHTDDEVGFYWGKECTGTRKNTHSGKKYVHIGICGQDEFEQVAKELSSDLRAIDFFKCPRISDYSVLERFHNLEYISGYWNNSLKKLWNASKTPKINEIIFQEYSKLDCSSFADFTELKYLCYSGERVNPTASLEFLCSLKKLEQFWLNSSILNNDIRPILALPHIKNYFVGNKYHKIIERYLKDGTLPEPQPPSIYSDMPTSDWRENESTSFTKKQIKQIEKILADYCNAILTAENIETAKEIAVVCVNSLNNFAEDIETVEREQLFEYIAGKAKDKWHDQIVEVIENTRDW